MKKINLTNKYKVAINLISIALSLLIISSALAWKDNQESQVNQPVSIKKTTITLDELKEANGKDGKQCLVAIESTVYKIEDSVLWQNGEHSTSMGLAYCGADLTEVLKKSPHGKSKLEQLEKVGTLQQ